MRADRLLSLVMHLQNRGRTTTDRLARELEVSRRTVIRDLYALRVAGFPVYTERGPHGGVWLHEDFRMRLTDLTREELEALFTFSVPAPLDELGMGGEAKGALLKLAAGLPTARRGVDLDMRRRVYLDPDPWNVSRESVPTLSILRRAVWEDRWLRATFLRVRRIEMTREVAPYGLVAKGRSWYVVSVGRDGTLRVDRASAVIEAEILDEPFDRPADFDLARLWTEWADAYEAAAPAFVVTARVRANALPSIEQALDRPIERIADSHVARDISDWTAVRMTFDYFDPARSFALAHGGAIEVLDPPALRLSVADYARQTCARYEAPAG